MGRLLACKMQRAGLTPCLLFREGDRRELAQPLFDLEAESVLRLEAAGTPSLAPGTIEGLWVTTKAIDVLSALDSVLPALAESAPVILMHNGMGVLETLAERHPDLPPYSAITTDGAYLQPRPAGAEP
ncbi:MAG: 2-dehydropantoate 2-reductase, partial [Halieaceae bacterium]|nr:2-dehydropantoate 2-reductase [Halieaceae bacterium]